MTDKEVSCKTSCKTEVSELNETSRPLPDKWIDRLFMEFATTYGNQFEIKWSGLQIQTIKEKWAHSLSGYTAEEIKRGLKRMGAFPPNLEEFKELCRPPIDPETAFYEAVEQMNKRDYGKDAWTSPVIYWSAIKFGQYDLKHVSWNAAKKRWTYLLDKHSDIALPPIPKATLLIERKQTPADKEKAAKFLATIREQFIHKKV